jgi:hypothetical protein
MSSLDLDINRYSIFDMEQLFKLQKNKKYTSTDIELRETEIRTQLLSSGHIDKRLKRDLILFLTNVKRDLIGAHCTKMPPPTTLNVPTLDASPNYPSLQDNISASEPVYYPSINTKQNETITPISIKNSRINEIRSSSTTPFSYTQNSDFLPGTLNPLTTRILSRLISVDTRFRDSPYTTLSSDFSIHLPNRIQKVVSLELSSIEISPFSIQNISESLGNHYIHVSVFYNDVNCSDELSPSIYTFVLPDGQYTPTKLIDVLNFLFQEQHSNLSVYIDSYSGNTIIETTDNDNTISISFDFSTDMNGVRRPRRRRPRAAARRPGGPELQPVAGARGRRARPARRGERGRDDRHRLAARAAARLPARRRRAAGRRRGGGGGRGRAGPRPRRGRRRG